MSDREVIRRHSKSFALAARLLPRETRKRAEALYAWCRAADDQIDLAPDPEAAANALLLLRAEAEDVYAGRPVATPAADALRRAVAACGVPREYALELLDGFAMDVRGTRYTSETELLLYCHRVAGVVGLMMCHALGVTDDAALPHAAHLGMAMQLTNIARDVAEDWRQGRLYLPTAWLTRLPEANEALSDELLAPAVRRCLTLAEEYYQSGEAGLRYLSPQCAVAIRAAAGVYRAIGAEVAARGHRPSRGRAVVPAYRKIVAVVSAVVRSLPDLLARTQPVRAPSSLALSREILFVPLVACPTPRMIMNSAKQSQREVASSVAYALSLTALLSAVFFATVAINPKDTNYGVLPWAYCAGSIVLSIVCGWLSHRLGRSNQTVGDGEEPSPSITRPTHAV